MNEEEKLVAVISPWEKLAALVKKEFRVESLPKEKKVMVWREDLQTEKKLAEELNTLGLTDLEIGKRKVTAKWQNVD